MKEMPNNPNLLQFLESSFLPNSLRLSAGSIGYLPEKQLVRKIQFPPLRTYLWAQILPHSSRQSLRLRPLQTSAHAADFSGRPTTMWSGVNSTIVPRLYVQTVQSDCSISGEYIISCPPPRR